MVTSKQAFEKYGDPSLQTSMTMWDVPSQFEIGIIPKKLYCNKDIVIPLWNAFDNMVQSGVVKELKTWDGCFNIRKIKGSKSWSLHSWGLAVDVNAATNPMGGENTLSEGFIKCFKDAGFDWGGDFKRKDGMHFQIGTL